jgi:membrane-associated HD superfamily phosphohydrolase
MFQLSWLIRYFLCTVTLVVCNKCVISALVDLISTTHSVIELSQPTTRFLRQLLLSSSGLYHRTLINFYTVFL